MMIEKNSTLETLTAWNKGRKLRIRISKLARNLPSIEKYRLSDQMVRASRSVTANIAEGYGRYHYKENIQYCRQARGSLFELIDHLYVAFDENYINDILLNDIRSDTIEVIKILNGYINYLRDRKIN